MKYNIETIVREWAIEKKTFSEIARKYGVSNATIRSAIMRYMENEYIKAKN
ncbi:MAG: helix-turn-helix domain-containing protein [bacterium]